VCIWQRPHEDNRDQLVTCLVTLRNPALTLALTERDNEHGLTVLGLAVAWGHRLTIFTLADACKCASFCSLGKLVYQGCPTYIAGWF
jgi:hypothetical protein